MVTGISLITLWLSVLVLVAETVNHKIIETNTEKNHNEFIIIKKAPYTKFIFFHLFSPS